jgi:hypothetical protein
LTHSTSASWRGWARLARGAVWSAVRSGDSGDRDGLLVCRARRGAILGTAWRARGRRRWRGRAWTTREHANSSTLDRLASGAGWALTRGTWLADEGAERRLLRRRDFDNTLTHSAGTTWGSRARGAGGAVRGTVRSVKTVDLHLRLASWAWWGAVLITAWRCRRRRVRSWRRRWGRSGEHADSSSLREREEIRDIRTCKGSAVHTSLVQ